MSEKGGPELPSLGAVWEVPAESIELRNTSWAKIISGVVEEVEIELGIKPTAKGILAKRGPLLLYQAGSLLGSSPKSVRLNAI